MSKVRQKRGPLAGAALVLALAAALAGCGGGGSGANEATGGQTAGTSQGGQQQAGAQDGQPTTGQQPPGSTGQPSGAKSAFPKTIQTAKGDVTLDAEPKTVAITYFPYAEHLFAIGRADAVTGTVALSSLKNFPVYDPFLKDGKVQNLGDEANLEKIMAINPDVIIDSEFEDNIYDQLAKIANTVVIPTSENWQDTIVKVAAVIGEEEKARQYIDAYEKKLNELAARMETSGMKGKTAVFMMTWGKGFNYYAGVRMEPYYKRLGFKPLDNMDDYGELSLEGLSQWNPDYIFLGEDFTHTAELTLKDLEKNPVWTSLNAVKNGHLYMVDTEIVGPLAMGQRKGLDVIEKIVNEQK